MLPRDDLKAVYRATYRIDLPDKGAVLIFSHDGSFDGFLRFAA